MAKDENFEVLLHQLGEQKVQNFELLTNRDQVITLQKRWSRFNIVE